MKSIFLIILFNLYLYCEVVLLPVSTKTINWKEKLTTSNVKIIKASAEIKCKKYLDIDVLKENKLRAKHYILKNKAICKDDVFEQTDRKIKFNFGLLEIEKEGELIKETKDYIKIKNLDGTIIKIYKNGSDKSR
ncbi:MAG: hypothetical protein U9O56_04350 [Campylobacterota bacterium]|nr:hypothetical protein [Campylobacterota bacterium]